MSYEQCLELEQAERQQALEEQEAVYLEGKADGAFGDKPRYSNDLYLQGYIAGIKQLPVTSDGFVDYSSKGVALGMVFVVQCVSNLI